MNATRILLVEDNPVVAHALLWHLRHHGFEVTHVREASYAKLAVRDRTPDLIILDISLPTTDPLSPVSNGVDFLDWLCWMALPIPVIINTNHERTQLELRHPNVLAYLQKPTRPYEMLAAVKSVLAQSADQERIQTERTSTGEAA